MVTPSTYYAPAKKASARKLSQEVDIFRNPPQFLSSILNGVPDLIAILNKQRQVVYANKGWEQYLLPEIKQVVGLRPGESLNCVHAGEMEAGCGTSESCRQCGATQAILASQKGNVALLECRLARQNGEALDLRIWTSPIVVNGDPFTIFTATDISHEKRRLALERIFFHDLLNTATGLLGWSDLLQRARPEELSEFQSMIHHLTKQMIDTIQNQKILTAAENNELQVKSEVIYIFNLLQGLSRSYKNLDAYKNRNIIINVQDESEIIISDPILLRRVVENMLKNALEASQPGETITLGSTNNDKRIKIWVHNPNHIPREVQLQVFQRSFSTKAGDRGLGTYSMKLLGERYLKGKVTFTSSESGGTTFFIQCPQKL